jgi:phosphoribosyl-ATP pyrophosphohydrolase
VALSYYGLAPSDVLAELARRVGLGGLDEKAARKAQSRDAEPKQ